MAELILIKTDNFDGLPYDIYQSGDDFYMTREQIGTALGYENPRDGIRILHSRHKDRLDRFSRMASVELPSVGKQGLVVYNRRGIMEICRWSEQPKADSFMDWVWDMMDAIVAGQYKLIPIPEYQRMAAESRLLNALVFKAREIEGLTAGSDGTVYIDFLDSYASGLIAESSTASAQKLEHKTYTAMEIGKRLGISAHKVGLLTNKHNLKTEENGIWVLDKSPNSPKQVQAFRYYETIIPILKTLL